MQVIGTKVVNIFPKRLLSRDDVDTHLVAFLQNLFVEGINAAFGGASGVLDEDTIPLTSAANDTFSLDLTNANRVIDGSGNVITIDGADFEGGAQVAETAIPFENATGPIYSVGIKGIEVEDDMGVNSRSGDPEYLRLRQSFGEKGDPDSVVDNPGVDLTLTINSITESGTDYSGRTATVYLKDPVSAANSVAFFTGLVTYSAPNNLVVIPYTASQGPLGQTAPTFPISTTASDYTVVIEGVSWFDKAFKDLSLAVNSVYCFIGEVTGNGPAAIPSVFDISNQRPAFLISLDRAYDALGAGLGRNIFADAGAVRIRQIASANRSEDPANNALLLDKVGSTIPTGEIGVWYRGDPTAHSAVLVTHNIAVGTDILALMTATLNLGGIGPDKIDVTSVGIDLDPGGISEEILLIRYDMIEVIGSTSDDGLYVVATVASSVQLRVLNLDGSTPSFTADDTCTVRIYRPVMKAGALGGMVAYDGGVVICSGFAANQPALVLAAGDHLAGGNKLLSLVDSTGAANVSLEEDAKVTGHWVPSADDTYDVGEAPNNSWRDFFASARYRHLGAFRKTLARRIGIGAFAPSHQKVIVRDSAGSGTIEISRPHWILEDGSGAMEPAQQTDTAGSTIDELIYLDLSHLGPTPDAQLRLSKVEIDIQDPAGGTANDMNVQLFSRVVDGSAGAEASESGVVSATNATRQFVTLTPSLILTTTKAYYVRITHLAAGSGGFIRGAVITWDQIDGPDKML